MATQDMPISGGIWRFQKELSQKILYHIERYNKENVVRFKWIYTGRPRVA
jgi:hypothetical protein